MNLTFNANNRILPLFNSIEFISAKQIKRVVSIALPFLALYQPLGMISSVLLGAYKAKVSYENDNLEELTLTVCSVALSILLPRFGMALTHAFELGNQAVEILSTRNAKMLPKMVGNVVFIASILYATPAMIAISLLAQAAFELYEARQEWQSGNIPETIAKVALALIRTSQAMPEMKTTYRNWFGKKVTRQVLEQLVKQKHSQSEDLVLLQMPESGIFPAWFIERPRIDIDKILAEHDYSSNLEGLDFDFETYRTYNFSKLHFKNCSFNYTTAENCQFEGTTFDHCNMDNFKAIRCLFSNAVFSNSSLSNALLYTNTIQNSQFIACDMTKTCLNDSTINSSKIDHCTLKETNFLGMQIQNSTVSDCDLTDTLLGHAKTKLIFVNCTENKFTRPVIALAWNFKDNQRFAGLIKNALEDQNAIPLLFEYEQEEINTATLDAEVKSLLAQIQNVPQDSILSISDELVKRTQPNTQMEKLKAKAEELFSDSHGIIFPGGYDVQPELYGQMEAPNTFPDDDYRRSVTEIAAIRKAYEQKMPLLGICRGSQIVNIRNGGDLHQHVEEHSGTEHMLSVDPQAGAAAEKMREIMGNDTVVGRSMHHQANNRIGKGLHRVIHHEGATEALLSDDGNVILTQFHPETYLHDFGDPDPALKANENIFRYFLSKADQRRLQSQISKAFF